MAGRTEKPVMQAEPRDPICPQDFVDRVQPLLERQDLAGLYALLKSRWTPDQIQALLCSPHEDAKKVAALAVGLVGTGCCIPRLAESLKDPDPLTNQLCEHALWSIWLRGGTPEANHHVCCGAKALGRREFEHANRHFTRAIDLDPTFAEAYNQRAISHYLAEAYAESIEDCRSAVERMPCHFGAWAGMGHCHAHLGHLGEAIRCYERALEINPHLDTVSDALHELRQKVGEH